MIRWQAKTKWLSTAPERLAPKESAPTHLPMSRGEKIMLASVVIGGLGFAMNAVKFLANPRA